MMLKLEMKQIFSLFPFRKKGRQNYTNDEKVGEQNCIFMNQLGQDIRDETARIGWSERDSKDANSGQEG
jgi:hypothetical protein